VFHSRFMPCSECGASIDRTNEAGHVCSAERRADFQMSELRDEVASLELGVRRYLRSPAGRFEVWLAARRVRGQT
jgi:hypothetical protein